MKLVELARLARIEHGALAGLAVVAAYLYTAEEPQSLRVLAVFLSTVFAESFLFITNDMANMEEDRINRPWAPLVKGTVSVSEARLGSAFSLVAGITAALPLGPAPLAIYIAAICLGYLYNVRLKRVPLLGNVSVALTTSMVYVYGAAAAGFAKHLGPLFLLFLATLLANIGREVVKSVADYEGDMRAGIRTVAHVLGPRRALRLGWAAVGLAVLVSVPLAVLSWPQPLSVAVVATSALLIYACLVSTRHPEKGKDLMLLGFAVTLAGLFLSGVLTALG